MEKTYSEMQEYRCPRWDELPDIALYMDQVLTVLDKHLGIFCKAEGDSLTTSTMINNYVKQNVVLSPEKKKYKREQLAQLLMIGIVKRVLSISEIDGLIRLLDKSYSSKDAYNLFCFTFENALRLTFGVFTGSNEKPADDDTAHTALVAACLAVANKLLVTELLYENKTPAPEQAPKPQKKKPPEKDTADDKEQ